MSTVKLIECITSWQGEGPDVGKRMLIVRFKKCNKHCKWCDTAVKMRVTTEADYDINQLQKIMNEESAGIMITGGEPTFGDNFDQTVNMLNYLNFPIANIESNGYRLLELVEIFKDSHKYINYEYSPKIFSKDDLEDSKIKTIKLMYYHNVYIKLVCEKDNDFVKEYMAWLDNSLSVMSNSPYNHQRVFLMPEGRTRDELLKNSEFVFDMCEEYKFNFSSREHIIYLFI